MVSLKTSFIIILLIFFIEEHDQMKCSTFVKLMNLTPLGCFSTKVQCAWCIGKRLYKYHKEQKLKVPLSRQPVLPKDVFQVPIQESCNPYYETLYGVYDNYVIRLIPEGPNPQFARLKFVSKLEFEVGVAKKKVPGSEVSWDKGIILAYRMANRLYPYDSYRCHMQHYADYFTHGETFGSWKTLGYWPVSDRCPLHKAIELMTDVNSPNFKLQDNKGVEYDLGDPFLAVRSTVAPVGSFLRDVTGKVKQAGSQALDKVPSGCFPGCKGLCRGG